MIISVHKVHRIQQIAEEVKRELREQSIAYQDIEQEIMIETPAAAVMSDELSVAPPRRCLRSVRGFAVFCQCRLLRFLVTDIRFLWIFACSSGIMLWL